MNTPDARAEARNRANRRLRRLTIGTTALGIAATGVIGLAASISDDGSPAQGDAVALVVTGDTDASSRSSVGTASSSSSSTSTTPSVTSGAGVAHASTGGS